MGKFDFGQWANLITGWAKLFTTLANAHPVYRAVYLLFTDGFLGQMSSNKWSVIVSDHFTTVNGGLMLMLIKRKTNKKKQK